MRTYLSLAAILSALALITTACEKKPVNRTAPASVPAKTGGGADRLRVDFYVMSQCPYGVQVENAIAPALEKLGAAVDFRLNFIASTEGGKLQSLHGESEIKGDTVQLCAAKIAPLRYLKFVLCQNEDPRRIPDNWQACAEKADVDVGALRRCFEGDEGKNLLQDSARQAELAKAEGSPTMFIGGKPYDGPRSTAGFLRAICDELQSKPSGCADVKPAAKVAITIVNDLRCKPCQQIAGVVPQLKGLIPGLEVTTVDYGTPQGKKLFAEAQLKYLPAVLFDSSLAKEPEAAAQLERYLQPAGSFRQLAVGARFDPTGEICDNHLDDNGDGKVDCADLQCREQLTCRAETKKRLDVFVMSQCPYGVIALDALKEVLANFAGQGVSFGLHYIATAKKGGGFDSMHGSAEVEEDLRALCALHHYSDRFKFMEYIWCRNPNIRDSDWRRCAKDGIDAKVIEACATGPEGARLLGENVKLAQALGVEASPSWMANNKFPFSAIDAETIKKTLCAHNADLKGCDKTLSGMPAGLRAGGGAGGAGGSCGN